MDWAAQRHVISDCTNLAGPLGLTSMRQKRKKAAREGRESDLSNDVVGGGVVVDETSQDDSGWVLQAGVALLHSSHQALQIGVLLQIQQESQ